LTATAACVLPGKTGANHDAKEERTPYPQSRAA
jgi:hypothetical protein